MTQSTNAPGLCPRGCGFTSKPHLVAQHAIYCLTPRTMERLTEIGRATRTGDGCLLWNGQTTLAGTSHGQRAYTIAYEIAYGPIPRYFEVCHRCDRPGCFEPTHLFAAPHVDNMRDAANKRRIGGAVKWTRDQRLAAGLDGSKARAASLSARAIRPQCGLPMRRGGTCVRLPGHTSHCRSGRLA